jgi:DNA-binding response OmpR family regulator
MSRNSGKAQNHKWSKSLSCESESVSGSGRMFRGSTLERALCAQLTMARVLVIGADPRLVLKASLECAEHTVMMADEFDHGVEYFGREVADVALVVLKSRDSNALHAIAQIRAQSTSLKILVLAKQDDPMDFLALRMMGADDVLRQPLEANALHDAVDQVLRGEDTT